MRDQVAQLLYVQYFHKYRLIGSYGMKFMHKNEILLLKLLPLM